MTTSMSLNRRSVLRALTLALLLMASLLVVRNASADDSKPDSIRPPKDLRVLAVGANTEFYGLIWDNNSDTTSFDLLIRMTPLDGRNHVWTGSAIAQAGQTDGRTYPWLTQQICGAKFRVEVEAMIAGKQTLIHKDVVQVSCNGILPTFEKDSVATTVVPIPGLFLMVTPTTRNVAVLYYWRGADTIFVDVQLTPKNLPVPGTIVNMVLSQGNAGLKFFPWTYSRAPRCLESVRRETWISKIPSNQRLYYALEWDRVFLCLG